MAFNSKGAAGGAASGAATGAMVGGPWGAAIGGIAGGALGGFMGGKKYKSPHFSDVDLQRENPELWAQLQRLNSMAEQAEYIYNKKKENDAAIQAREVGQGVTALQDRLAGQGLLGTSAGLSTATDAEAALRERVARKAFEDQQQALAQANELRSNYVNQYSQAQKGVFNTLEAQAQADYAQGQQDNQALMSGLGSLAGAYGQIRNQNLMQAQRADDRSFYQNLYGGGGGRAPAVVGGYQPPIYAGPQGYTSYSGVPMYPGNANYPSYGGY